MNKSFDLIQKLLNQTPAAMAFTRGKDHIYELANPKYRQMIGRTEDQIIGHPGRDVLPETVSQGIWDIYDRVYVTGKAFEASEFSAEIDRKGDGELDLGYFDFVITPYVEDGEIVGTLTHGFEITDLVKAREYLESQEEQLRTFAENIPVAAWIADAHGSINWYNKAWYNYTGTHPDEMVGWGWKSVHSPEFLPQVLARWQTSIETGLPFEMTFPLKGADGRFRSFLTKVSPSFDHMGKVDKWFGTNTLLND